jgi:MerC mercury resistance protein
MKLINTDFIGIGASLACAVHCAVLPLFLSGLSVFGVNIIHHFWFETGMIGLAFVIGSLSLHHGFKKHHQSLVPFFLFAGGMLFLFSKQYWHDYELILLPFALVLIISAHIFNFRYTWNFNKKRELTRQVWEYGSVVKNLNRCFSLTLQVPGLKLAVGPKRTKFAL